MSEFVKMFKDGRTIEVHPLVVEEHKKLGWTVPAEKEPKPVVESKPEPKPKPEPKTKAPEAKKSK